MFQGFYGGSQKHPADLDRVLDRAWQNGLDKIIITVGTLNEFDGALNLASTDSKLKSLVFLPFSFSKIWVHTLNIFSRFFAKELIIRIFIKIAL